MVIHLDCGTRTIVSQFSVTIQVDAGEPDSAVAYLMSLVKCDDGEQE